MVPSGTDSVQSENWKHDLAISLKFPLQYKVVHYNVAEERLTKGLTIASFNSLAEAEKFVARFNEAVETAAAREGGRVHLGILAESSPYVFISHSSKDKKMLVSIRAAFDNLPILPNFFEDTVVGGPPSKEIARIVSEA